eukprot:TRINITY_DN21933_c0_g1_i1.p1 TRINITY_DN21933_c0_g1~~TRINITY_DN21933_c0_g1_i1.p1  ORF type:complete len:439 (+),score=43.49 TRINITY_DN21933_c0_g1_i1:177-1493(+)
MTTDEGSQLRRRAQTHPILSSERVRRTSSDSSSLGESSARREIVAPFHLWRPVLALFATGIFMKFVMFVEDNPTLAPTGFGSEPEKDTSGILDTGFVLTRPLYEFLRVNPWWNDFAALLNSLLCIVVIFVLLKATFWAGDYGMLFKVVFTQLLRGISGWFTYLPPSKEFLPSPFDVPEIFSSGVLTGNGMSMGQRTTEPSDMIPFVSFFSGHVANVVCAANFLYLSKHYHSPKIAIALHVLNVLQIIRLLATRGHYSIDIIVGWIVAVYVSGPAERVGTWYSRADPKEIYTGLEAGLPASALDVFEWVIRARDHRAANWAGEDHIPKPPLRIAAERASAAVEDAGTVIEAKVQAVEASLMGAVNNANAALESARDAFEEAKNAAVDGVKARADAATGTFEQAKLAMVAALEELSVAIKTSVEAGVGITATPDEDPKDR